MNKTPAAAAALCLMLANACAPFSAPAPAVGPEAKEGAKERARLARQLETQGKDRAALVQWQIVKTLGDPEGQGAAGVRRLEQKVEQAADSAFNRGAKALTAGKESKARQHFLEALALNPEHRQARDRLQGLEVKDIRATREKIARRFATASKAAKAKAKPAPAPATPPRARRKAGEDAKTESRRPAVGQDRRAADPRPRVGSQNAGEDLAVLQAFVERSQFRESLPRLQKYLANHPDDRRASNLLAISHREIGLELYEQGQAKNALPHLTAYNSYFDALSPDSRAEAIARGPKADDARAQQSFNLGLRTFSQDLEQSIAHWNAALVYDPDHRRAKAHLKRALKIKENLDVLEE